jgi:hypothetical protein
LLSVENETTRPCFSRLNCDSIQNHSQESVISIRNLTILFYEVKFIGGATMWLTITKYGAIEIAPKKLAA